MSVCHVQFHYVRFNVAITQLSCLTCSLWPFSRGLNFCACLLLAALQKVVYCVFSWHVAWRKTEQYAACRTLLSVTAIWQNFAKLQVVQKCATVNFGTHWASLGDLSQKCNILCYLVDFRNIIFLSVSFWVCRCN